MGTGAGRPALAEQFEDVPRPGASSLGRPALTPADGADGAAPYDAAHELIKALFRHISLGIKLQLRKDLCMRLNPGITLDYADDVLRRAETTWGNARGAQDMYRAYTDAVHDIYPTLKQAFAVPDLAAGFHSTAYWNLLAVAGANAEIGVTSERAVVTNEEARSPARSARRLRHQHAQPLAAARRHPVARHLDKQKYGQGDLARKAATAIRYLERVLKDSQPGEPVRLREGVTLEVWVDTDDRGGDVDLSILRSAADLDNLHQDTGARVLTDDIGMRLRAHQLGLKVVRLPEKHRKKGTALDEVPPQ